MRTFLTSKIWRAWLLPIIIMIGIIPLQAQSGINEIGSFEQEKS